MDTNGAGDTFATAYMLAMAGRSRNPGAAATWAASRSSSVCTLMLSWHHIELVGSVSKQQLMHTLQRAVE